jgi:hypothetical protein
VWSAGHPIAGKTALLVALGVDGLGIPSANAGTGPNASEIPAAPTTIRRTAAGSARRLTFRPNSPTRPGITEASNASRPSAIQHAASQSKALHVVIAAASTPTRLTHARGALRSRISAAQSGMKRAKTRRSAVTATAVVGRNRCLFIT